MSTVAHRGTVKWFNGTKGYGFIQRDGGDDVFVHLKQVEASGLQGLVQGQKVTFEIRPGRDNRQSAFNIQPAA
jgi:CspA family cold shock protein